MKHLPTIDISVVPHKKQRYDTCGDYFKGKGKLNVRVSQMNSNHEFLILIHELVEWYLTDIRGISIESIDKFDKAFKGKDPGNDKEAPYYHEHQFATKIEKFIAHELGVNWKEYDEHVNSL